MPFALAGLFASWAAVPPRAAALLGYVSGIVFFTLDFSWFGETAGSLLGPFAFILDFGPAVAEALAFAATAAIVSLAVRRCNVPVAAFVSAAAFAATEWLRSIGPLGVPFYALGAPLVETPLAPLAAYVGGFGLTFLAALAGASLAALTRDRGAWRFALATFAGLALAWGCAWQFWPARAHDSGAVTVAAVQGNIRQSLKWTPAAEGPAIDRYTAMTAALAPQHPQIVVWPETVIPILLNVSPAVEARFTALARSLHTVLIVGSQEETRTGDYYNDLYVYDATGAKLAVYRKRQLVPFAEYLPGPAWLRALPGAALVSHFSSGTDPAVIGSTLGIAPLICWESAFGDVAFDQTQRGARTYVIATDDAWFGTSDGPYAHAQFATLRAVESGLWVVRAAATGISGIIAPDGTWRQRSTLETQTSIVGTIGDPRPTLYARIGPLPLGMLFLAIVVIGLGFGMRRRA